MSAAVLSWMFAPNWDVWIEYDYMGFGTKNLYLTGVGPDTGDYLGVNVQQSVEKVLMGIDYRFNWGPARDRHEGLIRLVLQRNSKPRHRRLCEN